MPSEWASNCLLWIEGVPMKSSTFKLGLRFLFFCLAGSLLFGDALTDKVDSLFAAWNKPDSPGCALGIIKDGKLLYKRGYGLANLEYGIPITSKSVFRIGSTSKQFSAMCMTLLEEEGKFSLDDDIRKYIPELPEYEAPITIRHLLLHTSGIRDYLTLMDLAGEREDDFFTNDEVIGLLARQEELNFQPGEEHLYSNSGYFLLSIITKRITGESMSIYAEKNIFKSLGMENTHFHDDHTLVVKNRASGYSPSKVGGFQISMTTLDMIGDGGIFTCVDDLLLWDQNFYNNKLGKGRQELINKMITPGILNNGEKLDYALGLRISQYRGKQMISHGGSFVGFRAEMIRFPEQHFSVIVLANLGTINPSRLARRVAEIYLGEVSDEMLEIQAEQPKPIKILKSRMEEKVGAYYDKKRDRIWKIILENNALFVDTSSYRFRILPISQTRFRPVKGPVDWEIAFEKSSSGKPMLMKVLEEGEEPLIFEAVQMEELTLSDLEEYVGEYFSPELKVSYTIQLENKKLRLHHENPFKNYSDEPLEASLKDRFQVSYISLNFFRDEKNAVISFTMNAGRVQNIRFFKM
jgi:CubicO group peptidase (beta-lactamase class C family)